MIFTVVMETCI